MSGGQMSDILDRIAEHTRHHRTTLIFVNTRKMAERVAHQLAERLGRERGGRRERRRRLAPRRRPPRQPVGGAPPHRRDAPAGRRPARAGGHGVARAGDRRRPGRAGLPDRVAPRHRHLPPTGRPGQPPPRRDAGGPPLPDDPRRARGVHRAPRRRARGPARPARAAGRPARRPDPAAGGRGGLHRRARRRGDVGHGPPCRPLRRAVPEGLRRRRGAGELGDRDRTRATRRAPAPRRGQRAAARPARRAAGRAHRRGRHPRDRRLPRRARPRRGDGRLGPRGLRGRGDGGRHLPPGHALVAGGQGRGRHGPGARRRRPAADHSLLAGRGAGPHAPSSPRR